MKKIVYLLCSFVFVLSSCTSEEDIISNPEEKQLYADYSFTIDTPIEELEKQLDEKDSITVSMTPEYISGTMPQTKAGPLIPYQGTITKLANQKTVWKYGVGENKVPSVFCGTSFNQMTISELWKISLTIDLTDESYAVRGFEGEWTGWSAANLSNTQTRYQGNGGTSTKPEFFTFVWRIVSDINGRNFGYTRCYVPFDDQTKARIYVRIYE